MLEGFLWQEVSGAPHNANYIIPVWAIPFFWVPICNCAQQRGPLGAWGLLMLRVFNVCFFVFTVVWELYGPSGYASRQGQGSYWLAWYTNWWAFCHFHSRYAPLYAMNLPHSLQDVHPVCCPGASRCCRCRTVPCAGRPRQRSRPQAAASTGRVLGHSQQQRGPCRTEPGRSSDRHLHRLPGGP